MSNNSLFCEPVNPRALQARNLPNWACKSIPQRFQPESVFAAPSDEATEYALIKSAPDVRSQDVEVPNTIAVDVVVLWGRTILHATHLQKSATFSIGCSTRKGERCDFYMPEAVLGLARQTLLEFQGEMPALRIPPKFGGYLDEPGAGRVDLDGLRYGPTPMLDGAGSLRVQLSHGSLASLNLGPFCFQFAVVRAGKPIHRDLLPATDREAMSFFGASLVAIASFVASMAYFVPTQNGLDEVPFDEDQIVAMTHYLHASAEREREAADSQQMSNEASRDTEGGTGTRALYEEGKMGSPMSRRNNGRYGNQGPSDNPDPHLARERQLWEATHEGMIGLLTSMAAGDAHAPTAPWGRDGSLGRDPMSADGNMWGDNFGDGFGVHGLGLSGNGQGGGGRGEGIGLGDIGDFGNGAGLGSGQGFGFDKGHLSRGNHKVHGFRMRPGVTTVSGRLPPEVIQRIVRQNYGRFRSCYEQGLARNPNLEGRVQVRFIIGRDGTVTNAHNGDSDLPDANVVSCVIGAYYGLNFPEPEGGIVTVVYPIMFQPG